MFYRLSDYSIDKHFCRGIYRACTKNTTCMKQIILAIISMYTLCQTCIAQQVSLSQTVPFTYGTSEAIYQRTPHEEIRISLNPRFILREKLTFYECQESADSTMYSVTIIDTSTQQRVELESTWRLYDGSLVILIKCTLLTAFGSQQYSFTEKDFNQTDQRTIHGGIKILHDVIVAIEHANRVTPVVQHTQFVKY